MLRTCLSRVAPLAAFINDTKSFVCIRSVVSGESMAVPLSITTCSKGYDQQDYRSLGLIDVSFYRACAFIIFSSIKKCHVRVSHLLMSFLSL